MTGYSATERATDFLAFIVDCSPRLGRGRDGVAGYIGVNSYLLLGRAVVCEVSSPQPGKLILIAQDRSCLMDDFLSMAAEMGNTSHN
jgi:hypothetical protein